jgi:hypothetical protein
MWRHVTNLAWWIGVSLYFGGLLALGAVAAPAIRDAVGNAGITMGGFASPPLPMRGEVTGQIFGTVLARFTWVEVISLGLMLLGIAGFLFAHVPVRRSAWVLLVLWVALACMLGYDAGVLRPKVFEQRAAMWKTAPAHAADKDLSGWAEHARFDRLHNLAETLGRTKGYLLLAMILVTAWRGLAERPVKPVEKSAKASAKTSDGDEMMREV